MKQLTLGLFVHLIFIIFPNQASSFGGQDFNTQQYARVFEHALEMKAQMEREIMQDSLFEAAVNVIKKYETIHGPEHIPYVGYGHMLLPGEDDHLNLPLTELESDSILRVDLKKKMAFFKGEYKHRLLLGMLSYNVGQYHQIHLGGSPKSAVARLIYGGDFDIKNLRFQYSRWRKWNGKVIKSIERRRYEEFDIIYPPKEKRMDLSPASKEKDHKPDVELVQQQKHEYKLIGSFSRTPGLKLFSFSPMDESLVEVTINVNCKVS